LTKYAVKWVYWCWMWPKDSESYDFHFIRSLFLYLFGIVYMGSLDPVQFTCIHV
jgi:hypothetical protein